MLVSGFPAGPPGTNCFVVAPGPGERCVVIDPGIDAAGPLAELLDRHRLRPAAVLLTHGHLDHTYSVVPVCDDAQVPAWIHPDDRGQLTDPLGWLGAPPGTPVMGLTSLPTAEPAEVRELADGDTLELAGLSLGVLHTPGHTLGSVVFTLTGPDAPLLFAGDLLFAGAIGRTDLPGGSYPAMLDSLARVVLPLDDATVVHPGHGPDTTIARERATNPYLRLVAGTD
ncbi:MAG TPA: MBL fold metallo-hydrolase [Mycobacteriales bacterium]|nr:MBL fold metallo-hydrolase [Mycobacteriales bacterium]